jgi:hypothetical protein
MQGKTLSNYSVSHAELAWSWEGSCPDQLKADQLKQSRTSAGQRDIGTVTSNLRRMMRID